MFPAATWTSYSTFRIIFADSGHFTGPAFLQSHYKCLNDYSRDSQLSRCVICVSDTKVIFNTLTQNMPLQVSLSGRDATGHRS